MTPNSSAPNQFVLAALLKVGANWFFWIAGLSLINTVIALTGSHWRFIAGLGITELIDAVGINPRAGTIGLVIGGVLDLAVLSFFVLFGLLANQRHTWVFVVGMVLYVLDALLLLFFKDYVAVAFHAFVLYNLYRGLKASRTLAQLQADVHVSP